MQTIPRHPHPRQPHQLKEPGRFLLSSVTSLMMECSMLRWGLQVEKKDIQQSQVCNKLTDTYDINEIEFSLVNWLKILIIRYYLL